MHMFTCQQQRFTYVTCTAQNPALKGAKLAQPTTQQNTEGGMHGALGPPHDHHQCCSCSPRTATSVELRYAKACRTAQAAEAALAPPKRKGRDNNRKHANAVCAQLMHC